MPSGPGSANLAKQIENIRVFGVPVGRGDQRLPDRHPGRARGDPPGGPRRRRPRRGPLDPLRRRRQGGRGAGRGRLGGGRGGRPDFAFLYPDDAPIATKIEAVAERIYGADGVDLLPAAAKAIKQIEAPRLRATCRSTWPRRSTR